MADERAERIARNEAVFRKVNEGIEAGHRDSGREQTAFVCECGLLGCNQLIELTREQYERVRAESHRFVIVDGHEIPDVEDVVDRFDGVVVAEKRPETHHIVEETDPRS
jgi:hypothetical protein